MELAVLALLHELLLRWLASRNIVAVVLAAGERTPFWTLALAGMFLALRFFLGFLAPGLVLARLGLIGLDYWDRRRSAAEAQPASESAASS
jgi:hypothetical protein